MITSATKSAAVICVLLFLYTKRIVPKQVLLIVFGVIIIGESAAAGYIGVKTTTVTGTYDYPRGGTLAYNDYAEYNQKNLFRNNSLCIEEKQNADYSRNNCRADKRISLLCADTEDDNKCNKKCGKNNIPARA